MVDELRVKRVAKIQIVATWRLASGDISIEARLDWG